MTPTGLLPVLALLAAVFALRPAGSAVAPVRLAVLRAALVCGAGAVVLVEWLSRSDDVTAGPIRTAWLIALAVLVSVAVGRAVLDRVGPRTLWRHVVAAAARPRLLGWLLLVGVLALVVGELVIAVAAPPNNYDSMVYHLPRIETWVQNASVDAYPTSIYRQQALGPGAEYLLLHLRLLTDGDGMFNLLQWAAGAGCLVAISRIAAQLGASPLGQLLSAAAFATTPMVVLQATSTQTDLTAAFWVVATATLALDGIRTRTGWGAAVLLGCGFGLVAVTKATGLLVLGPLLLWWGIAQLGLGRPGSARAPDPHGDRSRGRPSWLRLRTVHALIDEPTRTAAGAPAQRTAGDAQEGDAGNGGADVTGGADVKDGAGDGRADVPHGTDGADADTAAPAAGAAPGVALPSPRRASEPLTSRPDDPAGDAVAEGAAAPARRPVWHAIRQTAVTALLVLIVLGGGAVIAGPFLAQNDAQWGNPLGPPWLRTSTGMNRHDPAAVTMNAVRLLAAAATTPVKAVNDVIERRVDDVGDVVGVSPDDKAITFPGTTFALFPLVDEDYAPLPLQSALLLLAGVGCLFRRGPPRWYALAVLAAGVLFAAQVSWQPWVDRLVLPLVALGAPMIGALLGPAGRGRPAVRGLVAVPLVAWVALAAVVAADALGTGVPRPLVGDRSVLTVDRETQRYARGGWRQEPMERAAARVRASGAQRVGLIQDNNAWEYPWWRLLRPGGRGPEIVQLRSMLPERPPAKPADVDAILCTFPYETCGKLVPPGWTRFREPNIDVMLRPGLTPPR